VVPHGTWTIAKGTLLTACIEEKVKIKNLLFFGVIRPNKGLHVLLEAMKQLPEFTLTIAGLPYEDSYQDRIRFLAKQLPHNQVMMIERFVSKQEMKNLFSKSSLIILPYTNFSSQSGVLYDALAYGLPIVATDVGGVGETVKCWDIGEVVPPNNPMALSEAIHRLSKPNRYKEVLKSVKKAKQILSWKRSAKILLDIYCSLNK
jgi:glycosyltransferase involved in cell wall biosynthesis